MNNYVASTPKKLINWISQISSEDSWKYNLLCVIVQTQIIFGDPSEKKIWGPCVGTDMSSSPFRYVHLAFKLSCEQHCSVCNSLVFPHDMMPPSTAYGPSTMSVSCTVTSLFRLQQYSHCMHGTGTIMYHSLTTDYRFNSSDFVFLLRIIFVKIFVCEFTGKILLCNLLQKSWNIPSVILEGLWRSRSMAPLFLNLDTTCRGTVSFTPWWLLFQRKDCHLLNVRQNGSGLDVWGQGMSLVLRSSHLRIKILVFKISQTVNFGVQVTRIKMFP